MSEIRATTISDAAGTGPITLTGQSAAKAWINFNGTGTVAIRDSSNVSSMTDNSTGQYSTNFSSSMSNANYSTPVSGDRNDYPTTGFNSSAWSHTFTTSSVNMATGAPTAGLAGYIDTLYGVSATFGDLA